MKNILFSGGKLFLITFFAAILMLSSFSFNAKIADAACKATATLIDSNKQAISAPNITASDWKKYGVRFIISGCILATEEYNLTYTFKEGNGNAQQLHASEKISTDHTRDIMFGGKPKTVTYTYTVVGKDANPVSGGIIGSKPDITASVSVEFVSGPTMPPTGNPSGNPTSTNTNTSTNSNTNTSKDYKKLNTNIGIDQRQDYDQPIGKLDNLLEFESIPALIVRVLQILLALIGIVTTIVLIVSAFRLVAQGDNEAERTKAKKAITWAIIGLVVSLMSFSIVAIVQRLITQS